MPNRLYFRDPSEAPQRERIRDPGVIIGEHTLSRKPS